MPEQCPTCRDTRHVPDDQGGYKRCPDCFDIVAVEQLLKKHAFPSTWAHVSLAGIAQSLGPDHELVVGLQGLFDGTIQSVHFYGPPTQSKQLVFAATLRGLLSRWLQINVLDTAELAPRHYEKDRQTVRLKPSPIVMTVGKEIEKKLGAFYLRNAVEFAVAKQLPMALFSDRDANGLDQYYPDFPHLYHYAKFISIAIP